MVIVRGWFSATWMITIIGWAINPAWDRKTQILLQENMRPSFYSWRCKWATWKENDLNTNWISVWLQKGKKFKVFKLSCQRLDLNCTEMWRVSETGISCLLSWGSSEWTGRSELILSTTYWEYTVCFLYWMWKEKRRSLNLLNFFKCESLLRATVCV